jgi:hypothetical protein
LARAAAVVFNRGVNAPTTSDYRFSPALTARLLGFGLVVGAVLVLLSTLAVAWWNLHTVVLLVPAVGVLVALVALMVWTNGYVVRFGEEGYQVRRIRGAGVPAARWKDVEDAVTTHVHGSPCIVLRLRDGGTTTIPVETLNADRDAFARELRERLAKAQGLRRL